MPGRAASTATAVASVLLPNIVEHEHGRPQPLDGERGFVRAHCDDCGHDLLVAFSCKSRTACPSCAGRRMANTGAAIVDRVLPDVPIRQFVLSLPFELRKLAAFKAGVLTALGRILVDTVFASYVGRAERDGVTGGRCGAINFVQRFGSSVNLHVHFHVAVLDGVFVRSEHGVVVFHAAAKPTEDELVRIVLRVLAGVAVMGAGLYGFHRSEQFLIRDPRFALNGTDGALSTLEIHGA